LEANGFRRQEARYEEGKGYAVLSEEAEPLPEGDHRCRRRDRGPCPECGSTSPPHLVREMTALSWMLVGIGLLIWPLLALGLRLRGEVWRCWDCDHILGRGRRSTLGW